MPKLIDITIVIAITILVMTSAYCDQLNNDSEADKYTRIDNYLQQENDNLPKWGGGIWLWISVKRNENTIVYEYRAMDSYKGGFDHEFYKNLYIKTIRKNSELVDDKMNFKMIHILPNGQEEIVNIIPKDYMIEK